MTARPWSIPRIWPGSTIVCIASGPSLSLRQIATIYKARIHGGCRVIAINDNYLVAPWADVLYACDYEWWALHENDICCFYGSIKMSCMQGVANEWPDVMWIPYEDKEGFSTDPQFIHSGCNGGNNSGFQAVNIAFLFGARKIVLVGYDHKSSELGGKHWFGAHNSTIERISNYNHWIKVTWSPAAKAAEELGVDIVNCTPDSAIKFFRRSTLETELSI